MMLTHDELTGGKGGGKFLQDEALYKSLVFL